MMDKLKVFISDDSATVRERLVTMALDLPEVDVVGQAQDAPGTLDAVTQTQPDVVILDIRMPGGNGIEVLRELKTMTPAPQVIMLTNFAYAQYRKKCKEAGADFFFDKSTEIEKLPQALEQVRQSLRRDPDQTPDSPAQAFDEPIPAERGLTSAGGQNAGSRRCPELPRKLRAAYSKETEGSPLEQGHIRRHMGFCARPGQRVVRQTHRRGPRTGRGQGRSAHRPAAAEDWLHPRASRTRTRSSSERGQGRLESDHKFVLRRTEGLAPSIESRKKAENPWFSHEREERTK
jgi:DNA-binding NarL/FixJ family response regulator